VEKIFPLLAFFSMIVVAAPSAFACVVIDIKFDPRDSGKDQTTLCDPLQSSSELT
jgi:hypothetical protein